MLRKNKKFDIAAVNRDGIQVSMRIIERNGVLYLLNGLDMQRLSLPDDWKWEHIEREVKSVSGVIRMAMTNA